MPSRETISRARVLLPIASMTSGPGPTNASPAAAQRSAKAAFSERNP